MDLGVRQVVAVSDDDWLVFGRGEAGVSGTVKDRSFTAYSYIGEGG